MTEGTPASAQANNITAQAATGSRALHFTSRREIEGRKRFNPACLVTRENYAGIVGDYNLPEVDWMACQLRRKRDPCNTAHGYGWLARTIEGDEACIGGDCADKYFEVRSKFARDRARANYELAVDELLQRISSVQSDDEIPRRVDEVLAVIDRVYQPTRGLIQALPTEIVAKVRDMAKLGRTAIMVEIAYTEKPEKPTDKPRTTWQPYSIGDVRGVRALDTTSLKALSEAARAVTTAWNDRQSSRETPRLRLRQLASTLEGLGQIEAQAAAAVETLNSFREHTNLDRCAFLTRNDEAQRAVFHLARGESARKTAAHEAWLAAVNQIKAKNGDRRFRIP